MSKSLFCKTLLFIGLLSFLPTAQADGLLLERLVETPKIDGQLLDALDGNVKYNPAIRHIDFSKVIKTCLTQARLNNGLTEFGHYHSTSVKVSAILSEIVYEIVIACLRERSSGGQGNHYHNTIIINNNEITDEKHKSEQGDITQYPAKIGVPVGGLIGIITFISCIFMLPSAALSKIVNIISNGFWGYLFIFICAVIIISIPTMLITFILACCFGSIKTNATTKSEQEFKFLLQQALKDLFIITSRQGIDLKIVSKDPVLQAEMDKLFGNHLPTRMRLELLQSRLGKNLELISSHWASLANESRKQLEAARVV